MNNHFPFLYLNTLDATQQDALLKGLDEIKFFQELPIVVVGNKSELLTSREVDVDQVKDWIQAEFNTFQYFYCYSKLTKALLSIFRISVIECSALKKENITTIFRNLLELSKLKQIMDSFNER